MANEIHFIHDLHRILTTNMVISLCGDEVHYKKTSRDGGLVTCEVCHWVAEQMAPHYEEEERKSRALHAWGV